MSTVRHNQECWRTEAFQFGHFLGFECDSIVNDQPSVAQTHDDHRALQRHAWYRALHPEQVVREGQQRAMREHFPLTECFCHTRVEPVSFRAASLDAIGLVSALDPRCSTC